jgi:hypothetical protein
MTVAGQSLVPAHKLCPKPGAETLNPGTSSAHTCGEGSSYHVDHADTPQRRSVSAHADTFPSPYTGLSNGTAASRSTSL